jgi:hypothetical protein
MQDYKKNIEQVVSVYNLLIDSSWFKEELVDLSKIGRKKMKNIIKPKKTIKGSTFKKKVINKIISILKKLA